MDKDHKRPDRMLDAEGILAMAGARPTSLRVATRLDVNGKP